MSLTTHEIGEAEHRAWFAAGVADPSRRVLVYEHDGIPSGVVNFTGIDGGTAVWGFFLDVEGLTARDATLPAWMSVCREAVDYAFDVLGVDRLDGEVFAANTAVRRLNRRLGFIEGASRVVVRPDGVSECIEISLARADRRPRREPIKEAS